MPKHLPRTTRICASQVTDPAHVTAAAGLRRAYQQPRSRSEVDDLVRDLADYDKAFGIDAAEIESR